MMCILQHSDSGGAVSQVKSGNEAHLITGDNLHLAARWNDCMLVFIIASTKLIWLPIVAIYSHVNCEFRDYPTHATWSSPIPPSRHVVELSTRSFSSIAVQVLQVDIIYLVSWLLTVLKSAGPVSNNELPCVWSVLCHSPLTGCT